MSKTDTDLLEISRSKPTDSLNEPTFSHEAARGRTINVFDYETADGMPFMLAYRYDGGDSHVVTNPVDTPDGERMGPLPTAEAIEYLHRPAKTGAKALNFWYNLNFDINIFLKDLDDSALQELRATNSVEATVGGTTFQITYIPKKMLELREDNDMVSRHYDLSQFCYSGTLDDAASDWLDGDAGKAEPSVDPTMSAWDKSLQRKDDSGIAYVGGEIERYSEEVAEYARRDADLTYDIAYEVVRTAEDEISPAVPFGKPYSTGFVAGDFLKAHMESKVQYRSDDFQRAALKSYAGGRFEIYERGRVEDAVAGPDINSAYPAVMDSLPALANLSVGSLESFEGDAIDVLRRTYGDDYYDLRGYGFVKAKVTTDASRRIQPFAVKNEDAGRVEFPALENREIWTIAPIFCHAIDAGYVEDYEIIEGAAALPEGEFASLKKAYGDYGVDIGGLYAKRKALEAEGRNRPAKLIKIVLNSLYGKTCQIDAKRYYLENYVDENEDDIEMPDVDADDIDGWIDALPAAELPNEAELTDHIVDGNQIVEEFVAGSFFNPAVASYTTGMTRLKLHESVVSAGIEDDVLMFATDCILTRKDSFDSTALADAADSTPDKTDSAAMRDALGGWDYDYVGDEGALLVASGIYEIYDSDAENGVEKTKARGFRKLSEGDYPPIRDCIADPDEYLNEDGDISVTNLRPRTFGEVVFRGKSLRLIGEFFEDTRGLSPDMDCKRRWRRDSPSFAELSAESEVGKPPVEVDSSD
jgi:hypothetical protein